MSEPNDDSSDDEDVEDIDEFYDRVINDDEDVDYTKFMNPMAGIMVESMAEDPSEEVKIAKRMMMAGNAMKDFSVYVKENDIDIAELDVETMQKLDYEERVIISGFISMSHGLQHISETFDDDDDDNPFKVSDGDDPVY